MPRASAHALILVVLLAGTACASRGREIFVASGCVHCHRFRGKGSAVGPDLSGVASRMDTAALVAQITNPGDRNPASRMPAFNRLTWFELRSLIAYLRS